MSRSRTTLWSLFFILSLTLADPALAEHRFPPKWVGKKVNVQYDCCGGGSCLLIRSAPLTEVKDKWIVVLVDKEPLLIPKYLIQSFELSNP